MEAKAPPLKSVKDGAPQVQNLNLELNYRNSIKLWSADDSVDHERAGHPPDIIAGVAEAFEETDALLLLLLF